MGRLSEYVNSGTSGGSSNGSVDVIGVEANMEAFGHIMTTDPQMASVFRKYIRNVLREARNKLSKDAKAYMKEDPRRAARAVRYSVYKSTFGGNLSILQKKRGTAGAKSTYERPRTLSPGQRGGNRLTRVESRNRLDQYFGADRGFVLRFIGSGTVPRTSRFGNRGSIGQTNWFGHTAPWHMEDAAAQVAEAITEYINYETR